MLFKSKRLNFECGIMFVHIMHSNFAFIVICGWYVRILYIRIPYKYTCTYSVFMQAWILRGLSFPNRNSTRNVEDAGIAGSHERDILYSKIMFVSFPFFFLSGCGLPFVSIRVCENHWGKLGSTRKTKACFVATSYLGCGGVGELELEKNWAKEV